VDGGELAKVSVEARVVGHERGPKLRVVKFKPKRGYKRRNGHRQDLTRLEVTSIKLGTGRAPAKRTPKPAAAGEAQPAAAGEAQPAAAGDAQPAEPGDAQPAERKPPARKPKATPEGDN